MCISSPVIPRVDANDDVAGAKLNPPLYAHVANAEPAGHTETLIALPIAPGYFAINVAPVGNDDKRSCAALF